MHWILPSIVGGSEPANQRAERSTPCLLLLARRKDWQGGTTQFGVGESLHHGFDGDGGLVERDTPQVAPSFKPPDLALELRERSLTRRCHARPGTKCRRDPLEGDPIQHRVLEREPPEHLDRHVDKVVPRILGFREPPDLGMEEFEGRLGERVHQLILRPERAVDSTSRRARGVGNGAHRQRLQSLLSDDALRGRAEQLARRLIMFSRASHA